MAEVKQSKRIQTSLLNGVEHKALVWLAARQPSWMTSNILTIIGTFGSLVIAIGYILSNKSLGWLWLSSLGFAINWYGDSLDGNLARFRHTSRPLYGYYIDHNVDVFNEFLMFMGLGLSPLMDLRIGLLLYAGYLMLTVYVSICAHLKSEFKLTYAKLGPTELRVIIIILNAVVFFVPSLIAVVAKADVMGQHLDLKPLDFLALLLFLGIVASYLVNFFRDLAYFAKIDPPKKADKYA